MMCSPQLSTTMENKQALQQGPSHDSASVGHTRASEWCAAVSAAGNAMFGVPRGANGTVGLCSSYPLMLPATQHVVTVVLRCVQNQLMALNTRAAQHSLHALAASNEMHDIKCAM
jgi:hypothetical protein